MVHDIDRPDVGGVPPKMAEIANKVKVVLDGMLPFLVVNASDNIMSSVRITGSFQEKALWNMGILENSPYFKIHIVPMDGKRYYDPAHEKVVLEMICFKSNKLTKLRKYTGPVDKVIEKLLFWIESQDTN